MSDEVQDELWPHFAPLWTDLRQIAPGLLLAGGYGLFLKQQWLNSQSGFLVTGSGDYITTPQGGKLVVDEVRTLVAIYRAYRARHHPEKDTLRRHGDDFQVGQAPHNMHKASVDSQHKA